MCRWGKIRSIAYVPSFEAVQREMEEKMRKERLVISMDAEMRDCKSVKAE